MSQMETVVDQCDTQRRALPIAREESVPTNLIHCLYYVLIPCMEYDSKLTVSFVNTMFPDTFLAANIVKVSYGKQFQ